MCTKKINSFELYGLDLFSSLSSSLTSDGPCYLDHPATHPRLSPRRSKTPLPNPIPWLPLRSPASRAASQRERGGCWPGWRGGAVGEAEPDHPGSGIIRPPPAFSISASTLSSLMSRAVAGHERGCGHGVVEGGAVLEAE